MVNYIDGKSSLSTNNRMSDEEIFVEVIGWFRLSVIAVRLIIDFNDKRKKKCFMQLTRKMLVGGVDIGIFEHDNKLYGLQREQGNLYLRYFGSVNDFVVSFEEVKQI